MGYPYENLDDTQFEKLVVVFARKLFGLARMFHESGDRDRADVAVVV